MLCLIGIRGSRSGIETRFDMCQVELSLWKILPVIRSEGSSREALIKTPKQVRKHKVQGVSLLYSLSNKLINEYYLFKPQCRLDSVHENLKSHKP